MPGVKLPHAVPLFVLSGVLSGLGLAPSPAVKNPAWRPAGLGVPWAGDFTALAANEINVKTDPRLRAKAAGDGHADDTPAIRAAIQLASSSGGGVVYFPAGDYKIITPSNPVHGSPLLVPSRVILRGDSSTTSRIYVNDPSAAAETDGTWTWGGIDFQGSSWSGMTDLGVRAVNSSDRPCALLWNRGSRKASELFFNNLDIQLENCKNFWFEAIDHLLVQNSHFDSNSPHYGPIYVVNNSHVSFLGNTIAYRYGRVQMQNNKNLLMQRNTLLRDAGNQDIEEGTAIESGGVELSFGQDLQVLNNTIQTRNAPSSESGDGEAIMTQQSTIPDVLDAGGATAITSTTLTDTHARWGPATASRLAQYPEVVAMLTGSATGEWRAIQGLNPTTKTLTLSQPWNPVPEPGSLYSIFAWTLMDSNIQGNTLLDNPNGIVLWDGGYGCTVQNNTLTNSRGILLRTVDTSLDPSLYPEGRRVHQVAIQNKILNNTVSNTSGLRPAYIALDTEAFEKDSYRRRQRYGLLQLFRHGSAYLSHKLAATPNDGGESSQQFRESARLIDQWANHRIDGEPSIASRGPSSIRMLLAHIARCRCAKTHPKFCRPFRTHLSNRAALRPQLRPLRQSPSIHHGQRKFCTEVSALPDINPPIALPENAGQYVVAQNYAGYTREEQHTWKSLYDWRMEQLREHACHEYLQGLTVLGITGENLPAIDTLNLALQKRADWKLLPVKGFLPGRIFFDLLAARVFPTTTYLRAPESIEYTPEPDIFHDVFGHVPMHAHRVFADYLQAFAQLARRIESAPEQEILGRLFWYTVEFGLIRQQGKVRLYGSGVISSQKESTKVIEGRQEIHDFDLEEVLKTAVKVDELQPVLFVIDSFEQIYEASQEAGRLFGVAG